MAILNEYELHKLAIISYVEFQETIENKRDALIAMNILPPQGSMSDKEYAYIINKTLNNKLDKSYLKPIDTMVVLQENTIKNIEINIPAKNENEFVELEIIQKDGKKFSKTIKVLDAPIVRDIEGNLMQRDVNGVSYERRSFEIPEDILANLDFDYHKINIKIPNHRDVIATQLAYAPEKCHQTIDIKNEKVRGTSVAIPSIRSSENIGMGNYSDFAQAAHIMGKNNLDIIGTLPIHSMNHNDPESASPYSPDSRTFFNFGYLDVTAIEDFKQNKRIQEFYDSEEFEKARRKNQDAFTVDYTTSYELLMPMLKKCYMHFSKSASEDRKNDFEDYKKEKGDDLYNFALFQTLRTAFCSQDPQMPDWRDWPKEYQNPNTPEVKEFAKNNKEAIEFFSYLQWETLKQIQNIQKTCLDAGMKIGLYTDLAVGTVPSGFEAWAYKDLYLHGSLGIPPDMCSAEGQNWGIIGYNPVALDDTGYKSFINMMEANMQGGMLRIDCPLCGFYAANIIPEGKTAKDCFKVYMPTDKLMALTALTSHKTQTPIVFEDLGAIPDHFREKIQKMNGVTYKVLPYERCSMRNLPQSSIVVSSTHDSESLSIGWTGESAYLLANQNCLPDQYVNNYLGDSWKYRDHMTKLLKEEKIVDLNPDINHMVPESYIKGIATLIGSGEHCSAAYGIMPIGDILGIPSLRENLPGTAELHTSKSPNARSSYSGKGATLPNPNWRKKLPLYLNEIAINPRFLEVSSALSNSERKENPTNDFVRHGRNEKPRRDPTRLVGLFSALARAEEEKLIKGENTRFAGDGAYSIWGARFSPKSKKRLEKKALEQAKNYEEVRAAIEKKKETYRKGLKVKDLKVIIDSKER